MGNLVWINNTDIMYLNDYVLYKVTLGNTIRQEFYRLPNGSNPASYSLSKNAQKIAFDTSIPGTSSNVYVYDLGEKQKIQINKNSDARTHLKTLTNSLL